MGTYIPAAIEAASTPEITSTRKRQRRSLGLKRQIVEETLVAGASVARVARAHGVNANQVFQWRRLYDQGRLGPPAAKAARLLPVGIAETANEACAVALKPPHEGSAVEPVAAGSIRLEFPKARVHIAGNIDPAVLRLVLQAVLR